MDYSKWIIWIGSISIGIIAFVFILLYKNRASEEVLPVLLQVLVAVLAAAALLTIALSKPVDEMRYQTNFLMFRNTDTELLSLSTVLWKFNPSQYHVYYLVDRTALFTQYTPSNSTHSITDETFDELLMAAFLQWMAFHYSIHWQMDHFYLSGISGGGGSGNQIVDSEEECNTFYFSDTPSGFLPNITTYNRFQIPNGSSINIRNTGCNTIVSIKDKYFTFTFNAMRVSNGGLEHSILGDLILAHLHNPESYYTHNYLISLTTSFNRIYQWSPETRRRREWMEQVYEIFERDFSWQLFEPKLQGALEAIPKDQTLQVIRFTLTNSEE